MQISRRRLLRGTALLATSVRAATTPLPRRVTQTIAAPDSPFIIGCDGGAITSLRYRGDRWNTDYIRAGAALGGVQARVRSAPSGDCVTGTTATAPARPAPTGRPRSIGTRAPLDQVDDRHDVTGGQPHVVAYAGPRDAAVQAMTIAIGQGATFFDMVAKHDLVQLRDWSSRERPHVILLNRTLLMVVVRDHRNLHRLTT